MTPPSPLYRGRVKRRILVGFALCLCLAAAAPACGASVVFEDDGAGGGASSSSGGSKSASGSKATSVVSATQTSTVVGTPAICSLPDTTPPDSCPEACSMLFDCGLLFCGGQQNCPGFFVEDKPEFMAGCIDGCAQQPGVMRIVDPFSCDTTIDTFESLFSEFQFACQGFEG